MQPSTLCGWFEREEEPHLADIELATIEHNLFCFFFFFFNIELNFSFIRTFHVWTNMFDNELSTKVIYLIVVL